MLDIITNECIEGIQKTAIGIQKRLAHIAMTASKVPKEMSNEFGKRMKDMLQTIADNLQKRDEIFFKQITDYKVGVLSLQSTNAESIKFLSDKVFSLSSSLLEFKSMVMQSIETDNSMALVHHQREQVNARQQEARDDITMSSNQIQELVTAIKQLSKEVNALRNERDADKKGE